MADTRGSRAAKPSTRASLLVSGLFSGIGGLELGLAAAGHRTLSLCEIWEPARRVLTANFPAVVVEPDVCAMRGSGEASLLAAGFPCSDLSQVGLKAGIGGAKSGLVEQVFRLAAEGQPEWILLENVPNMLVLHKGAAMRLITSKLERLGYRWAYRTVDSRFTGLPQRRLRVLMLASRGNRAPEDILFADDAGERASSDYREDAYGFYWTEGRGGVGWAQDAIPTLKGGSTIGLASPPAIWVPDAEVGRRVLMLSRAHGETLQGFPTGWTDAAITPGEPDHRWKLLGNAVTVRVAEWVGDSLARGGLPFAGDCSTLDRSKGWPSAAFGSHGAAFAVATSPWPEQRTYEHLLDAVDIQTAIPLSNRATSGFLRRLDESGLTADPHFHADLDRHVRITRPALPRARAGKAGSQSESQSWASSPAARRRMQANRSKDTGPELELRRALFARGLRYRLHARAEPAIRNRIDVVFRRAKVAVDVRGCFWHACPEHGTKPKANADRWATKLARNRERDDATVGALEVAGWLVIIVWEHDDVDDKADQIAKAVRDRTASHRGAHP